MKPVVLVIGGGLAGLTAALRLQQAGCRVQVLEAKAQAGGRMGQGRSGPIAYNTGARLIYPFGRELHALIGELGLRHALVPLDHLSADCRAGGETYRIDLMPGPRALLTPRLGWADRIRLLRAAAGLALQRGRVDPDSALSAPEAGEETLAAYIRRTAGPRVLERLVEPVFRGTRSWNAQNISASFYASTTPHLIGRHRAYTLREGMGQLTAHLSLRLDVRCSARVRSIARRPGRGCVVRYEANGSQVEVRADHVVCAVEGNEAGPLLDDPLPQQDRLLRAVRYNSLGIVHYALAGNLSHTIEFATRDTPTRIGTWQETPATVGTPAMLYCQLNPEANTEAIRMGCEHDLDRLVRSEIRFRIPDFDARVRHVFNQWIPNKLPMFYPGYGSIASRFLDWQAESPRAVYFCGDYLSQALLNGACASGASAAQLLLRHSA